MSALIEHFLCISESGIWFPVVPADQTVTVAVRCAASIRREQISLTLSFREFCFAMTSALFFSLFLDHQHQQQSAQGFPPIYREHDCYAPIHHTSCTKQTRHVIATTFFNKYLPALNSLWSFSVSVCYAYLQGFSQVLQRPKRNSGHDVITNSVGSQQFYSVGKKMFTTNGANDQTLRCYR